MSVTEYTPAKMHEFLKLLRGLYDAARVVDPFECREIILGEDGSVGVGKSCFSIWGFVRSKALDKMALDTKIDSHVELANNKLKNEGVKELKSEGIKELVN